ncbi:MAG: glycosyl hydrolase [Pseudomonadota bacterium]|nr:glycosyl hydrolase [Pseudomonadota bacterium]
MFNRYISWPLLLCLLLSPLNGRAAAATPHPLAGVPLRPIGPAITSGRISDFAFHPERSSEYWVATASGGLWKTENDGITWSSPFDAETSYSIGVVTLDPNDPLTVWVGTGENNAQRSVAYGDGVYKSTDGGKSWRNMGLEDSAHISQIWVNPADSNHVLVAAQGPLWSKGGDRGLYRSTDGGESWTAILTIDADTGVNEFVVDPQNTDTILASTYQRRRHVWTMINGGPGGGVHRTTDGGANWQRINAGLPAGDLGRIGLASAPSAANVIYAIVEADDEGTGVYRSDDFGSSWTKRSGRTSTAPFYYNEIVVDPKDANRVYSLDTFTSVSEDGGASFERLGSEARHVDDHAIWIDPNDTDHLVIGGDGGIYVSFDRGTNWRHVRNLPITQFYRIQPDTAYPFYNVCGGTQDNNSLCAPSRTTRIHGITNADWTLILGGDGYEPQIDPVDPDTIYTQYQYGGLARYDRRTQERIFIAPQPPSGEDAYRWNWNTPLLISPHDRMRIYYAAEKLFRSDDRGMSWTVISPDLSRGLDRNALEVMGRVQSVDAIAKNDSTSVYGSAIGLDESTLVEGLIYLGTDDGVMNVTEDGGTSWRRTTNFRGVPDMSLIEDVIASLHDEDVVYAVFDNHKQGDFRPYVSRSDDRGRTWQSISGDLPSRGSAHTIVQDHVDANLLFVGTEFGVYFTQDGGQHWHALTGNFPTIAVRDLEIQRREQDLVIGTFGRGIYILDDYSLLRTEAATVSDAPAHLFEVRDALLYVEGDRWGGSEKGSQGTAFFAAPNPDFGAVFTYHLKDELKTRAEARRKAEQAAAEDGDDTPYPSWDDLRAEDREEAPTVMLVVRDAEGAVVRRIPGAVQAGLHRTAWDLRLPATDPVSLTSPAFVPPWAQDPRGPLATPGEYTVTLTARQDGALTALTEPRSFTVRALEQSPETSADPAMVLAFQQRAGELDRAVKGAVRFSSAIADRIAQVKATLPYTQLAVEADEQTLRSIEARHADLDVGLTGDRTVSSRNEMTPWSIARRARTVYSNLLDTRTPVPALYEASYEAAEAEFSVAIETLRSIDADLTALEARLESLGAPYTPGRMPTWPPQ